MTAKYVGCRPPVVMAIDRFCLMMYRISIVLGIWKATMTWYARNVDSGPKQRPRVGTRIGQWMTIGQHHCDTGHLSGQWSVDPAVRVQPLMSPSLQVELGWLVKTDNCLWQMYFKHWQLHWSVMVLALQNTEDTYGVVSTWTPTDHNCTWTPLHFHTYVGLHVNDIPTCICKWCMHTCNSQINYFNYVTRICTSFGPIWPINDNYYVCSYARSSCTLWRLPVLCTFWLSQVR